MPYTIALMREPNHKLDIFLTVHYDSLMEYYMGIDRVSNFSITCRWRWEAYGLFGYTTTRRGAAAAAARSVIQSQR